MTGAEGVEEGDAVVDDGVDVGNVGDEAVGEAVALVVDGADGEAGLGEVDGGELDEPAGLAGEAVDDGQGSEDRSGRKWGPPLGEELEASGIGDVLGGVRDFVAGIEGVRGQRAEGALVVRLRNWVRHFVTMVW